MRPRSTIGGARRYGFADQPTDWLSVFGGSAWTQVPEAPTEVGARTGSGAQAQWYLYLYDPGQPDLNWQSADVAAEANVGVPRAIRYVRPDEMHQASTSRT